MQESFLSAGESEFLILGYTNDDGTLNTIDAADYRKFVLGTVDIEEAYADVTGDGIISLVDLIRQQKNIAVLDDIIKDGNFVLNDKSVYKENVSQNMRAGAKYMLVMNHKADRDITVKFNGEKLTAAAADEVYEYEFTTPFTVTPTGGIDLQLIGVGTVNGFSIKAFDTDNELVENWKRGNSV